jgi:hypothetical protein
MTPDAKAHQIEGGFAGRLARFDGGWVRAVLAAGILWSAAQAASAQEQRLAQSQSGQFFIRGLPVAAPASFSLTFSNLSFVRLDPAVLAVSCERIKHAVLDTMGLRDQWRDRIFISLHPVQEERHPILVRCTGFRDGWVYNVDMPERVDSPRLIKVVVEVLLLEIANRRARHASVELPPWLAEGLAAHLQATSLATLAMEPGRGMTRKEHHADPLGWPRRILRARPALTFDELNWPVEEAASAPDREVYRSCAHLFMHELLRLKNGRECLQEMLCVLPEYLNWQTAFLGSFRMYFPRLVDADKWWTLHVVNFTGRDLFSTWSRDETWRQFDAILHPRAQVRMQTNDLPVNIRVSLQTVISDWEYPRQSAVLVQILNRLQALRLRAAPDFMGLLDGYAQAVGTYLATRNQPRGPERLRNPLPPNPRLAAQETRRRLDELDAERDRQRPKPGGLPEALQGALSESYQRQPAAAVSPANVAPGQRSP